MARPKARTTFIGGTDIAAILGLNPYKSALEVYAEKVGVAPEREESEAARWGKTLQSVVAAEYRRRHPGVTLHRSRIRLKPGFPYMGGTPDYVIQSSAVRDNGGLEIKTAGLRQAGRWGESSDAVPEEYYTQCAWYMFVLNATWWDLAVLIGGQDYREYHLERDNDICDKMCEAARSFWHHHVMLRVPPPPDASESAKAALTALYAKRARPDLYAATYQERMACDLLREARKRRRDAEDGEMLAENQVKALIGERGGLILNEDEKVTWLATKDREAVNWRAVVEELHPPEELLRKHTKTTPGVRRLVVPRAWDKETFDE